MLIARSVHPLPGEAERRERLLGLVDAMSSRRVVMIGDDAEGRRLLASFHRGVSRAHVVRAREYRTPVKTRILAGGVHAARQQVVRIDRESGWPLDPAISAALAKKIAPALDECDAVL